MWSEVFDPNRVLLFAISAAVHAVPMLFYILTLRQALRQCESPTISARSLWILLLPVLGTIWHFFVVKEICESLSDEFERRHRRNPDPTVGQSIGIAMCVAGGLSMFPALLLIASIAYYILWVLFWVNVREISRLLDTPQVRTA